MLEASSPEANGLWNQQSTSTCPNRVYFNRTGKNEVDSDRFLSPQTRLLPSLQLPGPYQLMEITSRNCPPRNSQTILHKLTIVFALGSTRSRSQNMRRLLPGSPDSLVAKRNSRADMWNPRTISAHCFQLRRDTTTTLDPDEMARSRLLPMSTSEATELDSIRSRDSARARSSAHVSLPSLSLSIASSRSES